jgi:WD40 repeat protein
LISISAAPSYLCASVYTCAYTQASASSEGQTLNDDKAATFGLELTDLDEGLRQALELADAAKDGNEQAIQRLIYAGASLSEAAKQAKTLTFATKQYISSCVVGRVKWLREQYASQKMYCPDLIIQHSDNSAISAMCSLTEHGYLAATACSNGNIYVWCCVDDKQLEIPYEPYDPHSSDPRRLLNVTLRHTIAAAHNGNISALCSLPKGNMTGAVLASCGTDGTIKLWNLHDSKPVRELTCKTKHLIATIDSNGQSLLAACNDHIELWNLNTEDYVKWQPETRGHLCMYAIFARPIFTCSH